MAKSIAWKNLTAKRLDYDPVRITKLQLLYKGGYDVIKSAALFMPKWRMETPDAYLDRLAHAAYENNFAEIINDISASVFQKSLQILPATDAAEEETPGEEPETPEMYMEFFQDADLQGKSIEDVLQCTHNRATVTKCAYLGIDMQDNKPYTYEIDNLSVLDYECDEFGEYNWIILRKDEFLRKAITDDRKKITTTFKLWMRTGTGDNVKVEWVRYQITYDPKEPPKDDQMIPVLDEGFVDFKCIPVVCYDLPDELWTGGLIGQLCESMFCRTSSFYHALSRGQYGILVYEQGESDRDDDVHSDVEDNEHRGSQTLRDAKSKMNAVTGPKDKVYFAEMRGSAFSVVQQQLQMDKNELYRIVNQMSSITGSASSQNGERSGLSKQMDSRNKEIILSSYANMVKKLAVKILTIISSAEGEDLVWQCKGMDNYHEVDTEGLIAKINALPVLRANILSPTSYKQTLIDLASDLHPFANPGTLSKIQSEIGDAVDKLDLEGESQAAVDSKTAPKGPTGTKPGSAAKPTSKGQPAPVTNNGSPAMPPGESGHMEAPEGAHLASGQHVDSNVIYKQLLEDYKPKDIKWVKQVAWSGPMAVPLTSIDFSNQANWKASQEPEEVQKFVDLISNEGFDKPIILANVGSNNEKMIILDGHHRAMAYNEIGQPAIAYVAQVGEISSDMAKMHGQQGNESSQQVSSNQKDK